MYVYIIIYVFKYPYMYVYIYMSFSLPLFSLDLSQRSMSFFQGLLSERALSCSVVQVLCRPANPIPQFFAQKGAFMRLTVPLLRKCGTHKIVETGFWHLLSGNIPKNVKCCCFVAWTRLIGAPCDGKGSRMGICNPNIATTTQTRRLLHSKGCCVQGYLAHKKPPLP